MIGERKRGPSMKAAARLMQRLMKKRQYAKLLALQRYFAASALCEGLWRV